MIVAMMRPGLAVSCACLAAALLLAPSGCRDDRAPAPRPDPAATPDPAAPPDRAATPDPDTRDGAMTMARYQRIIDRLADAIARDVRGLGGRRFATRAEVMGAMLSLTPSSPASKRRLDALFSEAGVSPADYAAFVAAHPDETGAYADAAFEGTIGDTLAALEHSLDNVGDLPLGDLAAVGGPCGALAVHQLELGGVAPDEYLERYAPTIMRCWDRFSDEQIACALASRTESALSACLPELTPSGPPVAR